MITQEEARALASLLRPLNEAELLFVKALLDRVTHKREATNGHDMGADAHTTWERTTSEASHPGPHSG